MKTPQVELVSDTDKLSSDASASRRSRNQLWKLANLETHRPVLNEEDCSEVVNVISYYCTRYLEQVEGKVVVLKERSFEQLKHPIDLYLVLPYTTRFDERYVRRLRKKFKRLTKALSFNHGRHTFMTVTFDMKKRVSLHQMYKEFSKGVSQLIDRIKKKYRLFGYLKTFEFTHSYLIHAHILLIGVDFISPEWLTETLEKIGLGKIKHIKEFKGNVKSAFGYFFKYVRKQFNVPSNHDGGINENLLLAWALGIRSFSMSKSLVDLSSSSKTNFEVKFEWYYIGTFEDKGVYGVLTWKEFAMLYYGDG